MQFVSGPAAPAKKSPRKARLGALEARLDSLERDRAGRRERREERAKPARRSPRARESGTPSDMSAATTTDARVDDIDDDDDDDDAEEEEPEGDGFLLAFLVASGVDAPRAVRAAARLRPRGSYADSAAFAAVPQATLQQAGLRQHEIRAVLRAARLARQALKTKPRERLRPLRSKSAHDAAKKGRHGFRPQIDPTAWANKRRALVRSAERRRRLRQTE